MLQLGICLSLVCISLIVILNFVYLFRLPTCSIIEVIRFICAIHESLDLLIAVTLIAIFFVVFVTAPTFTTPERCAQSLFFLCELVLDLICLLRHCHFVPELNDFLDDTLLLVGKLGHPCLQFFGW